MTKYTPFILALMLGLIVGAIVYMVEAPPAGAQESQSACDFKIKPLCKPGQVPQCICESYAPSSCRWVCSY